MNQTILVVEDEKEMRDYLLPLLRSHDYLVSAASTGAEALQLLAKQTPDLLLLDLNLPDISGEGVCREVRKEYPFLPIIMLTAKGSMSDTIQGFQMGADDYVSKPFVPEELLARVAARLRLKKTEDGAILRLADLELNPQTLEVQRAGKRVELTPQEFKLIHYLMTNPGIVLSRDMILGRIWATSPDIETRVVDVYMGYLRKKIDAGYKDKLLRSVRGFGYMLKAPESE